MHDTNDKKLNLSGDVVVISIDGGVLLLLLFICGLASTQPMMILNSS
jgi:hypothetical protein